MKKRKEIGRRKINPHLEFIFLHQVARRHTVGVDGKTPKNLNSHFVGSYFSTLRLPDTLFIVGLESVRVYAQLVVRFVKSSIRINSST